jgi:glycosyltransferase involved in cell wall biosynthesis
VVTIGSGETMQMDADELRRARGERISILLPNLRGGGAERVAVNLANGFAERGYAVDVVLLSAVGEFLGDLRPEIRILNLRVLRERLAMPAVIRYLQQTHPTAMLACMWPLTVIALLARRFARVGTRIVVAEHTTWSHSKLIARWSVGWQVRTSMRWTFPGADGIVAVSDGAAQDLVQFANLDSHAVTTIYNPVVSNRSVPAEVPLPPYEWWIGAHRRVLAAGSLKPVKDHATLLSAFARLRERVNARLLILGEGACRSSLEAQAKRLGLHGSVFMPGFVQKPFSYYQQADLHVLSSTSEGFGNVLVEAMDAGTPVVSTDCPSGPREILGGGKFGRLVPVGDVDSLARAMAESLNDTHDKEALRARARDFTVDKAVDRYLQLLFPHGGSAA